ncbi:MAG: hypothetical protein ACI31M_00955 [Bacilli bacterium]
MKIWVKSQDGREMVLTGEFIICSYLVDTHEIICEGYSMAKYDSEKRAKEVLDEIMFIIEEGTQVDELYQGRRTTSNVVYQFPKF